MSAQSTAESRRLGRRIADAREAVGLTQPDLAQQAGVSPSIVSRIERGRVPNVSLSIVARLARVLDRSLDEWVGEIPAEERQARRVRLVDRLLDRLDHRLGTFGLETTPIEDQQDGEHHRDGQGGAAHG